MSGERVQLDESNFTDLLHQWEQETADGKTVFDAIIEKRQWSAITFSSAIMHSNFAEVLKKERAK
jgi:hypothetical protein